MGSLLLYRIKHRFEKSSFYVEKKSFFTKYTLPPNCMSYWAFPLINDFSTWHVQKCCYNWSHLLLDAFRTEIKSDISLILIILSKSFCTKSFFFAIMLYYQGKCFHFWTMGSFIKCHSNNMWHFLNFSLTSDDILFSNKTVI